MNGVLQCNTGCLRNIFLFSKNFLNFATTPSPQHWAAIGCSENGQPITITVHSHSVENFEDFLAIWRRGMGYSGMSINTILLEHPVFKSRECLCMCIWWIYGCFHIGSSSKIEFSNNWALPLPVKNATVKSMAILNHAAGLTPEQKRSMWGCEVWVELGISLVIEIFPLLRRMFHMCSVHTKAHFCFC